MTLTKDEHKRLIANLGKFRWYATRCNGTMPEQDSDDYVRLAKAFLAWFASSEKWYTP